MIKYFLYLHRDLWLRHLGCWDLKQPERENEMKSRNLFYDTSLSQNLSISEIRQPHFKLLLTKQHLRATTLPSPAHRAPWSGSLVPTGEFTRKKVCLKHKRQIADLFNHISNKCNFETTRIHSFCIYLLVNITNSTKSLLLLLSLIYSAPCSC